MVFQVEICVCCDSVGSHRVPVEDHPCLYTDDLCDSCEGSGEVPAGTLVLYCDYYV